MKNNVNFNYEKAIQAINILADKSSNNSTGKLKTVKLLWLADRYHLRRYGRPIFNDFYFAMEFGPVPSSIKDLLTENNSFLGDDEKKYLNKYLVIEKNKAKTKRKPDLLVFSKSDIEAIEKIFTTYGNMTASELVTFSHKFPEWKKFENELSSKCASRENMDYLDFFLDTNIKIKNNIFNEDKKVLDASKKIFMNSFNVEQLWRMS